MTTTLELQICQLPSGEYEVRVVKAAAGGEARAPLSLDVGELLRQRPTLQDKVLASSGAVRRIVPESEQLVQQVGRQLFDALFDGPVWGSYRENLSVARERQDRLQIVLRLDSPELTLLPWETLFDPQQNTYICRHEPMVRHLFASQTPDSLPVEPPLRILVVIASPRKLPSLDTDAERERLENALAAERRAGRVELVWLTDANWDTLHLSLMDGPWHVVHFIGHGDYDDTSEEGLIALVGEGGTAHMVHASALATLLGEAVPAPRLVVLNSCSSAQGEGRDGFSSVGAALVYGGISAVAAMQFAVTDQASVRFAQGFYTALAHGRSVDDAVKSGRISILGMSHSLEWITPVLYVRGEAGLLFTMPKSSKPPTQPPPRDSQHSAQARKLYVNSRAELRIGNPDKAVELLDELLSLNPNHSDAIMLRTQAADQAQALELYDRAVEAEKAGQWSEAIDSYEQILQKVPEYRDVLARRDRCRDRERIQDLQDELRHHAEAQRWQTVLEVSEELDQIDPTTTDPDGLTTRARQVVAQAAQAAQLEVLYTSARAAEQSENWATAVDSYAQILRNDPQYRDALSRHNHCRDQQRMEHLRDELRHHADAQRWQSVLDVSEELSQIDPTSTDPDGLTTRARRELIQAAQAAQLEDLYDSARAAEHSKDWATAIARYDELTSVAGEYRDSTLRRSRCLERLTHAERLSDSGDAPPVHPTKAGEIAAPCGALAWASSGWSIAVNLLTDPRIRLYDMAGDERLNIKTSNKWAPYVLAFSPDGTRLASQGRKGATVWDADTGGSVLQLLIRQRVTAAAFSWDGSLIATGTYDSACVWDAETGEELFRTEQRAVKAVTFSPDGSRLVVADQLGLHVWRLSTALKIFEDRRGFLGAVAYSPDGKRVATGSTDNKAHLWTSGQVEELAHDGPVTSVAFDPSGTRLATGSEDHSARIWDTADAHLICKILHDDPVNSVAFSPYGTRLATGTRNTVTLWTFR
ncbi:CHAT domain-containing protein [Streptomyces sp. NPDC006458]|uniref:CHAT domain-containing protein n=1 Tax=Streptomyces sp. NPDC006458 TaxID=3154302 RepID=UPI0033B80D27